MQKLKKQDDQKIENDSEKQSMFGQKKELPPNFANELFHYEMEIESDQVNIGVVNKLLTLYATAIEYYESYKNDRYLIFKNKTQKLLMRQNVNRAMNNAVQKIRARTEPDEDHLKVKRIQKQYKNLDLLSDNYENLSAHFSTHRKKSLKNLNRNPDNNNLNNRTHKEIIHNVKEEQEEEDQNNSYNENNQEEEEEEFQDQGQFQREKKQLNPQKREEICLNLQYISQQDNKDNINKMLETHKLEIEFVRNNIKHQLQNQQEQIERRLDRRKQNLQNKNSIISNNSTENRLRYDGNSHNKSMVLIKPEWAIKPSQFAVDDQKINKIVEVNEIQFKQNKENDSSISQNLNYQSLNNNILGNQYGIYEEEKKLSDTEVNYESIPKFYSAQSSPNPNQIGNKEFNFVNDDKQNGSNKIHSNQDILDIKQQKKRKQKREIKQGIKQLNINYVIPF